MSEVYLNCHVEEGRSPDVAISAIFLTILFPFSSHATCTPTPDCASIGYIETSCETISLKCPFDQTKLFCLPCDSSYQYTCSNSNEYGDGESCNSKYKSCCNTDCVVGNIYYSDKTCSSCVDTTKMPVGVVIKDNELILSVNIVKMFWANDKVDTAITNLSVENAKSNFDGYNNTQIIVEHYGSDADISETGVAGVYCYNYTPVGMESSHSQWYLPSVGEIYHYISANYNVLAKTYVMLGASHFGHGFWSSSEATTEASWRVNSDDADINSNSKYTKASTACVLKI